MNNIAIVIVAYNRVDSLSRLLDSVSNAVYKEKVTLIISIDKSDTKQVEEYADNYNWKNGDKHVIKHSRNLGLRQHILGLGKLFAYYDALIVLEDDIIVSPYFYSFAQQTIQKYRDDVNIAGISLYSFSINYHNGKPFMPIKDGNDVYFIQCAQSWGQIWLKDQWYEFIEWYKEHSDEFVWQPHLPKSICGWSNKSWLKYHTKYCIENNKYFVYPYDSYSSNTGDAGTHTKFSAPKFQTQLVAYNNEKMKLPNFYESTVVYDAFFENIQLISVLGLNSNDVCIDLNSLKQNDEKKRFWLTTQQANYQYIKSFGIIERPLEKNIINNRSGHDIYVYDTTKKTQYKYSQTQKRKVFCVTSGFDVAIDIYNIINEYGLLHYFQLIISILISKIKK